MLVLKPSIRLVIHYIDSNDIYKRHGDLFVEIPQFPELITYEVERDYLEILKKDYHKIYLAIQDKNIAEALDKEIRFFNSLEEVYNLHSNCDIIKIPLKRKQNHRKEYLQKEGVLSNGKGKIENFLISKIDGFVLHKMDTLVLIDKD